jgi:inner membrane protein
MPSAFSHAFVPLAIGLGLGRETISRRLLMVGMACATLPDADVLAFRWGIPYESQWGHRGFTHSLVFSLLVGLACAGMSRWLNSRRTVTLAFVTFATFSHALLDAGTNGGLGVALWWPFSTERFFWPFTPIEVSPISLRRFFSGRGLEVITSEFIWVWLPAIGLGLLLYGVRKFQGNTRRPDSR